MMQTIRKIPSRRLLLGAGALVAAVLLPLLLRGNGYLLHILILMAISAFFGTSWNMLGGFSGQMSLGHGVFLGMGAYASTLLYIRLGVNPWVAMLLGACLSAAFAAVIGMALFRLRDAFFTLSTMALLKVVMLLAVYLRDLTNGTMGLSLPLNNTGFLYINFTDKAGYYYVALVFLALSLLIAARVRNSRLGKCLFALRDDHDAAESLGVDTLRAKVTAMAASAFLVSMGGSLYAHYTLYIDPTSIFSNKLSVDMAIMSMLGGLGTVFGPLLGAALLVPIDAILRATLGGGNLAGLNLIVYGLIMIAIVQWFPTGAIPRIGAALKKRREKIRPPAQDDAPQAYDPQLLFAQDKRAKAGEPILRVENLTVRFGGLLAVNKLSFQVNAGEIFGLIGPNGAGKTTVFNAVSAYVQPSEGGIFFCEQPVRRGIRPHALCKMGLTRTFQVVRPFNRMTLLENVLVGMSLHMRDRMAALQGARNVLALVGLSRRADEYPPSLTVAEQKRLDMARALAAQPQLLMLDEPMAGLTHAEVDEMVELIRSLARHGVTVIIIEHVMKAVMNLCERVVVLDHGEKIAEGTPAQIVTNARVIDVYLGEEYHE